MSFYEYNANYNPPIPVCQIYLGAAGKEPKLGPLEAIIDTGADITIIPQDYLLQTGAKKISQGRARSLWGDTKDVNVYAVSLSLNGQHVAALQVLADERNEEIVLGRTILNRLKIILDGPAAITEFISNEP